MDTTRLIELDYLFGSVRIRNYELNLRYPFLDPLKQCLKAAEVACPEAIISR